MFGSVPDVITVNLSSYAALSEEQTVLSQSPRFVTQQVSHLAELLAQRGVPNLRRAVVLLPVHLQIPANEAALQRVDYLKPAEAQTHVPVHQHSRGGSLVSVWWTNVM